MKRQYIEPNTFCVKLDARRVFMDGSMQVSNDVIEDPSDENAGWAREDNDNNNRGNVWDNAW